MKKEERPGETYHIDNAGISEGTLRTDENTFAFLHGIGNRIVVNDSN